MISVFQINFDEKSQAAMDPAFYPYSNQVRDEFFENKVIRDVYEMNPMLKSGMTYIGVTSWKQYKKTHLSGKEILDFIQEDVDGNGGYEADGGLGGKDIYIYSPVQGIIPKFKDGRFHGTIRQPDIWSTPLHRLPQLSRDNQLLNSSGVLPFNMFDGKWKYCHCNYWIVKPHVFDDYCKNVLIPAMNFFNRPNVMNSLPKWYTHRHEGRKTTSICFTLEGLFGSFMAHRDYTVAYICKKKIKGKGLYKMVTVDGYEITK